MGHTRRHKYSTNISKDSSAENAAQRILNDSSTPVKTVSHHLKYHTT